MADEATVYSDLEDRLKAYRLRLTVIITATGALPAVVMIALGKASSATLLIPILGALPAYWISGWLLSPLKELASAARRLVAGDLSARALVEPNSPWRIVSGALHTIAERLAQTTKELEAQVEERTKELQRTTNQLRAVGVLGRRVASVLEPDRLQHFVVRLMRGAFDYDVVAILTLHGKSLVVSACAARDLQEAPLGKAFATEGAQAPPLAAGLHRRVNHPRDASPLIGGRAMQSELAVPIRVGGRIYGVLVVQSPRRDAFDAGDQFVVATIAGQVAVSLENARLLESERQLRRLAVVEERNRLAKEIHDTMAQGFMGLIMLLRAMRECGDLRAAQAYIDQAEELAQENLQEARRSVWNLRPEHLESVGLVGAITRELERLERRLGIVGNVNVTGDAGEIPHRVETALYRIAQESIRNAAEHGRPSRIDVFLEVAPADVAPGEVAQAGVVPAGVAPAEVALSIVDDGVGFDPGQLTARARANRNDHGGPAPGADGDPGIRDDGAPGDLGDSRPSDRVGRGLGLKAMRERAEELSGRLTITSAPGRGCTVHVRIPIETLK